MSETELNKTMLGIQMPKRIRKLPVSPEGYPTPWFVQWFKDGEPCAWTEDGAMPDFRVIDARKWNLAIRNKQCWVCGEQMGVNRAFVIGPMCVVNRVTSEPPCHLDCATFAARACPFLTKPRMRRNEKGLPEQRIEAPGYTIDRNPGVTCIWVCKTFRVFKAHAGGQGQLIQLDDPIDVLWYAEGKTATRAQVMASIESGYPLLVDAAKKEGGEALAELPKSRERAMRYLPEEEFSHDPAS